MRTRLVRHGFCKVAKAAPVGGAPVVASVRRLLINPAWIERAHFPGCEVIEVDPSEPAAANVLAVGERVVYARHHPRTLARLRAAGIEALLVDAGEVSKGEGAVTCCSVVFDVAS